jgi:hypothetical protein
MTNEIAQRGFAAATSVYERGRPDYPDAVIAAFSEHLAIRSASRLVDLASGSGKLGRRFLGRAEVIAVEQAAEMCTEFVRLQPGVPVIRGIAEALPLADASVDAVVIGTVVRRRGFAAGVASCPPAWRAAGARVVATR